MTTKFRSFLAFSMASLSLLLSACGTAHDLVSIGMEAEGTQIELKPGQELVISLESNPSTGYGWHIANIDEAILKPVGEVRFIEGAGDDQIVGASGMESLRFEAVGSGTTILILTYDRIWESVPPEKTFTLTVVIP